MYTEIAEMENFIEDLHDTLNHEDLPSDVVLIIGGGDTYLVERNTDATICIIFGRESMDMGLPVYKWTGENYKDFLAIEKIFISLVKENSKSN